MQTAMPRGCRLCPFNFWPDGGCHLSQVDAVARDVGAVIAGPRTCSSSKTDDENLGGVAQNESDKSALHLWLIDGVYYDLSPLLSSGHPGGALPLLQTRGTDASVVFRVQHIGHHPRKALEKYIVRQVTHKDLVVPALQFSFASDGFYETVKDRVRNCLRDRIGDRSPRKASSAYVAKLAINLALFTGTWFHVVLSPLNLPTFLSCLVNAVSRLVLTGMAHDAIHGILLPNFPSFQSTYASAVFRGLLNFASARWHEEHVIGHHPFTKTASDPDENLKQFIPVWRLTNKTDWNPMHSYPLFSHVGIGGLMPILNGAQALPKLVNPFAVERVEGFTALSAIISLHLMPFLFRPSREGMAAVALTSMLASGVTLFAFHMSHLGDHLESTFEPGVDWGEFQMRTSTNFISYLPWTCRSSTICSQC